MIDPYLLVVLDEMDDEEERYQLRIRRRQLRDLNDPLDTPENIFRGIYRLSRECVVQLTEEISPFMDMQREEIAIPKLHRILATLHLLSHGSYQKCVGQDLFIPMAQQTLSKCVNEVTSVIVNHLGHRIKFPTTEEEQTRVKERFVQKGGFPGIVGAIDCTHIALQAPSFENAEMPGIIFLNRKGFYSINTQIIVDADLRILAVNARFPGSVHDSAIWGTSSVKRFMEQDYLNGNTNSWLIGDSGYPLQPFLITPINDDGNLNQTERDFNRHHKSSRNVVERLNGLLKARFRCCLGHRTLHYKPNIAANIVYSCCILHNMCLDRDDIYEDVVEDIENEGRHDEVGDIDIHRNWLNEGRLTRQRIINNYINQ